MDGVRYFLVMLLALSWPPGMLYWIVIHPLAPFWRRVGAGWAYLTIVALAIPVALVVWRFRAVLTSVDFGLNPVLVALGLGSFTTGVLIAVKRKRFLTRRILVGQPELSNNPEDSVLLTEGPYAVIRHPRYVEALFFVLAYALISNYLLGYAVLALSVPLIILVVALEERELSERFGAPYEAYRSAVPRFIPRLRKAS